MNRARDVMRSIYERQLNFPVLGTPLFRLQERGPLGESWWNAERGGRPRGLEVALQPGTGELVPAADAGA